MTNITLNTATRKCTADKYFLGYEGENNINKLIFKFEDGFRDGLGVLNVKREEEKGYLELEKVGDTYELEVKSALLSKIGEITFQLTVNEPSGTVIKYDAFSMVVKDSIDTDVEMPEDYPNWIDMANAKLAELDETISEVKIAKENGEFNGKDGFSPVAKVTQTEEGAEIEITDENGTTKAVVRHGQGGGEGGGTGADGFSPIANVTQTDDGAIISVTDKTGTSTAIIKNGKNGEKGDPGEAGANGLTPHIGENGNWWIGDMDTGKPASGSGGGLAELPIASKDILGGIKVGEGLEITEDGILSVLAGGGAVGKIATLFEGAFATENSSLTLNDDIKNYDVLVVNTYVAGAGGHKQKTTTTIIVGQINYVGNDEYCCYSNSQISAAQYGYTVRFGFDSSGNTLLLGVIYKSSGYSANEIGIDSVYGIKLNAGSSNGSSYSTTELLSSEVTSVGTYTLSDSVFNYDEVLIEGHINTAQGTPMHKENVRLSPSQITVNANNEFAITSFIASTDYYSITFGFDSTGLNLLLGAINIGSSWSSRAVSISKVIGIKY